MAHFGEQEQTGSKQRPAKKFKKRRTEQVAAGAHRPNQLHGAFPRNQGRFLFSAASGSHALPLAFHTRAFSPGPQLPSMPASLWFYIHFQTKKSSCLSNKKKQLLT
jgi:hypothetical protein